MKFPRYITLLFICAFLYSCSSGEYDIEQVKTESVEKTLKYDTLYTNIDTSKDIIEDVNLTPVKRDTYSFIVQIGAYRVTENFERFFSEARNRLGNEVYYELVNNLYKIRIGKFNTKPEALIFLDKIIKQGYSDAFVVTVKNPN